MASPVFTPKVQVQEAGAYQAGNPGTIVIQMPQSSQGSWTGTMVKTAAFVGVLGFAFYLGHSVGYGNGANNLLDSLANMDAETGKSFLEGLQATTNDLVGRATLLTKHELDSFNRSVLAGLESNATEGVENGMYAALGLFGINYVGTAINVLTFSGKVMKFAGKGMMFGFKGIGWLFNKSPR